MGATKPNTTVNLDDLQSETERLVSLLRDRQPGCMSWWGLLHERLVNIRSLIPAGLAQKGMTFGELSIGDAFMLPASSPGFTFVKVGSVDMAVSGDPLGNAISHIDRINCVSKPGGTKHTLNPDQPVIRIRE